MLYEDLFFKRGYLVTDWDISAVESPYVERVRSRWVRESVGRFTVYHEPDLQFHAHAAGGLSVAVLGVVIDPVNRLGDPQSIIQQLHGLMSRSTEAFFERLDDLSGRFVVLVDSGAGAFAVQDAVGTKTLFYDDAFEQVALSSHSTLLAELTNRRMTGLAGAFVRSRDYIRELHRFPGLTTPYPGIKMLTPNTLLDLVRGRVERFYPRVPLVKHVISPELVEELADLFVIQVDLLQSQHPLAVSITAGGDSRTTMAATAEHKDKVHYFTYIEQPIHEREALIAEWMCADLGVSHTTYRVDRKTLGAGVEEYMEAWKLNTAYMRAESLGLISKVLYEGYPTGYLHLKSNVAEIGRAVVRGTNKRFLPREISPETMARLYNINPGSEFVKEAFREYMDTVGYTPEAIMNYDVYDLYVWEHRYGAWQGLQIADMDPAQDTFILYNNRRVLERMLSVPLEDRLWARLFPLMINKMWPECMRAPFLKELRPWHQKVTKEVARKVKYRVEGILDRRRS